jgi:hypothetical protein
LQYCAGRNSSQSTIHNLQHLGLHYPSKTPLGQLSAVFNLLLLLPHVCPAGANPRVGKLKVDGVEHAVYLQDMPTVVESYKTLDDANLVKVADLGQVGASPAVPWGFER